MKPAILLIAVSALVAPLSAQDHNPGTDLIDLFEKSQREGMSDEKLMQMLHEKALIDDKRPHHHEAEKAYQMAQERMQNMLRQFAEDPEANKLGKVKEPAEARRMMEKRTDQEPGEVRPPRWVIGLVLKPLAPPLRSHFALPEGAGMVVDGVMSGGPAAKAGIKNNDIVVSANGRNISSLEDLKAVVEQAGAEEKPVQLEVIHRGKRDKLKLEPIDAAKPAQAEEHQNPSPMFMTRMNRLFELQQREIDRLHHQVDELRRQVEKLQKREER